VLADQLFTDQIHLRLAVPVQCGQVKKGVAEFLGADQCQITRLGQLVLHQIGNKRNLVLTGLLAGLAGHLSIQQFFLNDPPGQAGENGGIHRSISIRCNSFGDYSTASPCCTKWIVTKGMWRRAAADKNRHIPTRQVFTPPPPPAQPHPPQTRAPPLWEPYRSPVGAPPPARIPLEYHRAHPHQPTPSPTWHTICTTISALWLSHNKWS